MSLTKTQSDNLKWMAITLMLIDHIGAIFFPEVIEWRLIGRLAFPLFAFQLAISFKHTRNHSVQLRNLLIFAILSQIPYQLAIQPTEWTANIFFTLMLGYLLVMAWEMEQRIYIPIILVVALTFPVDYGVYGVALPFLFYVTQSRPLLQFIAFALATVLYGFVESPYQLYALLAFVPILLVRWLPEKTLKTSKWFFYAFYPVHLLFFVVMDVLIK